MFSIQKFLTIALLALVIIGSTRSETVSGELTVESEKVGDAYHIVCKRGDGPTEHTMCHAEDKKSWPTKQHVEFNLRCPNSGSGNNLAYIQIDIWAPSDLVSCDVTEGGIGSKYANVVVKIDDTDYMTYEANFYSV